MKGNDLKGQNQAIVATFLYSTGIIHQKRDRLPGKKEFCRALKTTLFFANLFHTVLVVLPLLPIYTTGKLKLK